MKSMMNALYTTLTDGQEEFVEANEKERFITWCLPGIPIDKDELRFLERGLVGQGKPQRKKLRTRDDNAWTRIVLDQSDMRQLSDSASSQVQDWLPSRDLLDDVEKAGLAMTSLSVEVFPLSLVRPWLDTSVFTNRFWKWDDQPLSDGGDPPQGILPAYMTQVIFARNLEIGLDFPSPANMAVAAQGLSQRAMLQVSKAPVSIKHMTNLRSVAQPVMQAKAVNIRAMELAVHLGIHTGLVVGDVGEAPGRNSWRSVRPQSGHPTARDRGAEQFRQLTYDQCVAAEWTRE